MTTEAHPLQSSATLSQIAREQRLQVIVRKGLPPFRQPALELTKALSGESPDLKKAAKLISADPTLSSQVLRMCNSPLLGLHSRVISIDHAATLLGPERLRSLALTTSVADFAGKALPDSQMIAFWQHSLMTAMLSQLLAKRWKYFAEYQAYIAGLLHDIGQVPEWILLSEAAGEPGELPANWTDNPPVEQEYFGIDHCKLGGIMARSWDLMPSFLDVLENHHTPELALRDSVLVRLVAAADTFLKIKAQAASLEDEALLEYLGQKLLQLGQGLFGQSDWRHVEESLEREYARVLPIAQAGPNGLLGKSEGQLDPDADGDSRPMSQQAREADQRIAQLSSPNRPAQAPVRGGTAQSGPAPVGFLERCKKFVEQLFS
ncbi:MAG TPA: HDOD domain-containing protein [Candidatus Acidoferrales bacterium]|nr:HDOD domain-containing protein [Candidatus Acidoferrales bacterium]